MTYVQNVLQTGFTQQLRQRIAMRRTAAELRALSDASLDDIGMNRADVDMLIERI